MTECPIPPLLRIVLELEYQYEVAVAKFLLERESGNREQMRQWWRAREAYLEAIIALTPLRRNIEIGDHKP